MRDYSVTPTTITNQRSSEGMLSQSEVSAVVRGLDVPGFRISTQNGSYVDVCKLNVMNSYRRDSDGQFRTPNGGTGELRSHAKRHGMDGWRDEADLISSIFACCQMLNDHELREFFFYKATRPFDPHHPQSRVSQAEDHFERSRAAVFHAPDIPPNSNWYDRPPYFVSANEYEMRTATYQDIRNRDRAILDAEIQRERLRRDLMLRAKQRGVDLSES